LGTGHVVASCRAHVVLVCSRLGTSLIPRFRPQLIQTAQSCKCRRLPPQAHLSSTPLRRWHGPLQVKEIGPWRKLSPSLLSHGSCRWCLPNSHKSTLLFWSLRPGLWDLLQPSVLHCQCLSSRNQKTLVQPTADQLLCLLCRYKWLIREPTQALLCRQICIVCMWRSIFLWCD
jgi:hypothetical protein